MSDKDYYRPIGGSDASEDLRNGRPDEWSVKDPLPKMPEPEGLQPLPQMEVMRRLSEAEPSWKSHTPESEKAHGGSRPMDKNDLVPTGIHAQEVRISTETIDTGLPRVAVDAQDILLDGGGESRNLIHPFKIISTERIPDPGEENQLEIGFKVSEVGSTLRDGMNGDSVEITGFNAVFAEAGALYLKISYSLEAGSPVTGAEITQTSGPDVVMGSGPSDGITEQNILIGEAVAIFGTEEDEATEVKGFTLEQSLMTPLVIKYDFYNGQIIRYAVPGSGFPTPLNATGD